MLLYLVVLVNHQLLGTMVVNNHLIFVTPVNYKLTMANDASEARLIAITTPTCSNRPVRVMMATGHLASHQQLPALAALKNLEGTSGLFTSRRRGFTMGEQGATG